MKWGSQLTKQARYQIIVPLCGTSKYRSDCGLSLEKTDCGAGAWMLLGFQKWQLRTTPQRRHDHRGSRTGPRCPLADYSKLEVRYPTLCSEQRTL